MERINKIILAGNIGRDPEIRYLPSGLLCCGVCDEVLAACRLTILTLRDYIKSCTTVKAQPVIRQSIFRHFGFSKKLGFFSTAKVNLRNAP